MKCLSFMESKFDLHNNNELILGKPSLDNIVLKGSIFFFLQAQSRVENKVVRKGF